MTTLHAILYKVNFIYQCLQLEVHDASSPAEEYIQAYSGLLENGKSAYRLSRM